MQGIKRESDALPTSIDNFLDIQLQNRDLAFAQIPIIITGKKLCDSGIPTLKNATLDMQMMHFTIPNVQISP
jgi:hypothetical protein